MLFAWLKRHFFPVLLFAIITTACVQNFTPSTYLSGWDNLMPELNIWLNLKRSLFAVWQEYQGLGLVGGMGHATDLIRELIILPFTLILPTNLIRYGWHFSMLFLGSFGIFYGLRKTFKFSTTTSFLSALFYLLNFGTVQYFWAPLETFSSFWGFFPWLIFSLWDYLDHQSPSHLKKMLLINILAIPSFYVQTLFVVYIFCVSLILVSHFFYHRQFSSLKLYLLIASLLFAINSFWFLPQLYFLKDNLHNPVAGIGNFMSSDESFARNQFRGYPKDLLILRGYYTDFPDTEGQFMAPWINYYSNQYYPICGYIVSLFFLVGILYTLSSPSRISAKSLSLLFMLLLISIALLSATPPFMQINTLLRSSGVINQIFRAPFTKFIVPTIFVFSIFTAFGFKALTELITIAKYPTKIFTPLIYCLYGALLFIFSFPIFTGNLISPKLRVKIPDSYFEMFDFLQHQSHSARISNLPLGTFWGWTNYTWGYRGSGFIWYSLPQPILDRAFDAWNLNNEQYYWELDQALQKKDPQLLANVFKKYSIEYLLFDNNVYFPNEIIYSKLSLATQDLLSKTPGVHLIKKFGQISLFQTSNPTSPYLLYNPPVSSDKHFFFEDITYQKSGDYLFSKDLTTHPFLNLFSNRLQSELPYKISQNQNKLTISSTTNSFSTSFNLDNSVNVTKHTNIAYNLLSNTNSSQLLAYNFPDASLGQSYLVKVNYQHLAGLPLTVSINSDNLQQKYLTTKLDTKPGDNVAWFILPVHEDGSFNQGITVLFNNSSLNNFLTQNKVSDVNFYPLPYTALISQSPITTSTDQTNRTNLNFKNHLFYYQINLSQNQNTATNLALPQSFSNGWTAFYFQNNKINFLPNHNLANGWANSWELTKDNPSAIYILFWPQLFEFLGFGLLGITIYLVRRSSKA